MVVAAATSPALSRSLCPDTKRTVKSGHMSVRDGFSSTLNLRLTYLSGCSNQTFADLTMDYEINLEEEKIRKWEIMRNFVVLFVVQKTQK